ncbi:uncharacterized protein PHACADRAFT_212630 [Phanerochaete carnosa HHB-10118-sp]|uniref:NAD(P)-binding protein n=1 Tax=Phanerochaete carnosa (strain HHB-10118-sp) TaxID=650164 RepID=K5UQC9_PHACS|nr:uncharacterized protein PHACADRAFT_212630 [Phanerochaete carnosa HHB-10118-sp]EKM52031.1 hypothetical protein PHACADRAFT_212630 [Phanerochaete carnosa HHB-10118-sp]
MSSPRVWLITGSSSGFGLAMCKSALAKGDKVVATLRRPSDISEFDSKYSSDVLHVAKVDVTRPEEVANAFREAKSQFGRVDVVFNNAASFVVGEVELVPDADARRVMEVNFWGAATVSKEAVRFFREDNPPGAGGLLLNVSSDAGFSSLACVGYYDAAKHALEGLTEALAYELDPRWNIRICLVTPGAFRSDIKTKSLTMPVHPAYPAVESVQQSRKFLDMVWDPSRPMRIGDVHKAAERIYEASMLKHPPMRLFLGEDCVRRLKEQLKRVTANLDGFGKWSEGLMEDE